MTEQPLINQAQKIFERSVARYVESKIRIKDDIDLNDAFRFAVKRIIDSLQVSDGQIVLVTDETETT